MGRLQASRVDHKGGNDGGGRGGRPKQRKDSTVDTWTRNVADSRSEHHKPKQRKNVGFKPQQENDQRARVAKTGGGFPTQPKAFSAATRSILTSRSSPSGSSDRRSAYLHRQKSTMSCISALSTQSGSFCERCNRVNRKLRDVLVRLIDTSAQAVSEWSHAVGVSPDHMEYERTKTIIVPDGFRRDSAPCRNCHARRVAEMQAQGGVVGAAPVGCAGDSPWGGFRDQSAPAEPRVNPFVQPPAAGGFGVAHPAWWAGNPDTAAQKQAAAVAAWATHASKISHAAPHPFDHQQLPSGANPFQNENVGSQGPGGNQHHTSLSTPQYNSGQPAGAFQLPTPPFTDERLIPRFLNHPIEDPSYQSRGASVDMNIMDEAMRQRAGLEGGSQSSSFCGAQQQQPR